MTINFDSSTIIGAVFGDVVGSVYEFNNTKNYDFDIFPEFANFTDDTVLTMAIADSILNNRHFDDTVWKYGRDYPGRGYGGMFSAWLANPNPQPYGSFGNGAGMRVSPVGFAYDTLEEVLNKAKETAIISHNHPEGIKGAQAIAAAIFLARSKHSKEDIEEYIMKTFAYDLNFTIDDIRDSYGFYETCQDTVPEAIVAFLESSDFEDAIRRAISLGGDSDTIACMTGGIASAYYGKLPAEYISFLNIILPPEFIELINEFDKRYGRS